MGKIDRKECFRLREIWYDCMAANTADLLLLNDTQTGLKCPLRHDCEKFYYDQGKQFCKTRVDSVSIYNCKNHWLHFGPSVHNTISARFRDHSTLRVGWYEKNVSPKIKCDKLKIDPSYSMSDYPIERVHSSKWNLVLALRPGPNSTRSGLFFESKKKDLKLPPTSNVNWKVLIRAGHWSIYERAKQFQKTKNFDLKTDNLKFEPIFKMNIHSSFYCVLLCFV